MRRGIFFICTLWSILSISFAGDYYWNDPAGGELGDSTKWNPPVMPDVDDYVFFNLPDNYTVWLESDYTHDRMTVNGSDLTLDLGGYTYFLDGLADYSRAAVIGDTVDGSMTVSGGGIYSGDLFMGWNSSDSTGRLNLSGGATCWIGYINEGYHGFFYGNSGDAEVSVTDNAYLEHGHGQSGIYRSALFNIDGIDTEWFVAGYFGMSMYGDTKVNLSNGARARFGYLEMGVYPHSSALINVTGTGHQTELAIENGWLNPVGLYIGIRGSASINLTGSKLLHSGHTEIAQLPGSRGQLNIYDGSWADLQGLLAVGGSLDQPGGEGLVYLFDDPDNEDYADLLCGYIEEGQSMIVWPEGTIRMDGGQITMEYDPGISANPIVLRGGTLEGWGWFLADIHNESGIVRPGVTSERMFLDIEYNYEQGPAGILKIGIGGTSSGWNYAVLTADNPAQGQVTLDGFLDVDLLAGFEPDYNDEFVIIQARSVTGQFINAPSRVIFEGGTFEVLYYSDRVILTHFEEEPKCPVYPSADLNLDCLVNLSDLAVMAGQWLQCGYDPDSYCPGQVIMMN